VTDIGKDIKRRFQTEIGEWMSCNIGVSTYRFLAKLAASLHKPDGLDVIDHTNVLQVYGQVKLLDLSGINTRYQARLNAYGIFTPLEFYNAPWSSSKSKSSEASTATTGISGSGATRLTPLTLNAKAMATPMPCKIRPMSPAPWQSFS